MPDSDAMAPTNAELHEDMRKLTAAIGKLATNLEPLAEHVPTIVEMARAWNDGKAVTKAARVGGNVVVWMGRIAIGIAAMFLLLRHQWLSLIGLEPK